MSVCLAVVSFQNWTGERSRFFSSPTFEIPKTFSALPVWDGASCLRLEDEKKNKSDPGGKLEELRDLGFPEGSRGEEREEGRERERGGRREVVAGGEVPWVLFYAN